MSDIRIDFVLPTGAKIGVDVPPDMVVEDAVQQLVEARKLELEAGQVWAVYFKDKNNASMVDQGRTFEENGVVNGTSLRLVTEGTAGGGEDIRVSFVLPSGANIGVDVPPDMVVEDAVQQLVEARKLELEAGQVWAVYFKDKNNASMVDQSRTFEENGVVNGTSLRLVTEGTAGGV
ncbi:MAG: hypothetical protein SOY30_12935 [Eubacteriales bacterium]|nr:hypothetical protein [Eubacteriales bacterium]